jgi:hypothetical protein
MPDHYDALETRDPGSRERRQAAALPGIIARAMTAPGRGKHLKDCVRRKVQSGWAFSLSGQVIPLQQGF